ncbi:MAG TPA: DinB family protein [Candidatus Krumholzibacteria bacterium]|nr:DinB family protein [Candidatus Krumholzibacteria bacterium]
MAEGKAAKRPKPKLRSRRTRAPRAPEGGEAWIAAWRTNHRVTTYLIENLPPELWSKTVPGAPRRTVRMIAAHIHNARCMWIKMLGARHGVVVPRNVDGRRVRPAELTRALARSSEGFIDLIRLGMARGGAVPPAAWQNFPTDLAHFLTYFVAHEAHHRGQLCLLARQWGHRLPVAVTAGLWQWKKRARE